MLEIGEKPPGGSKPTMFTRVLKALLYGACCICPYCCHLVGQLCIIWARQQFLCSGEAKNIKWTSMLFKIELICLVPFAVSPFSFGWQRHCSHAQPLGLAAGANHSPACWQEEGHTRSTQDAGHSIVLLAMSPAVCANQCSAMRRNYIQGKHNQNLP